MFKSLFFIQMFERDFEEKPSEQQEVLFCEHKKHKLDHHTCSAVHILLARWGTTDTDWGGVAPPSGSHREQQREAQPVNSGKLTKRSCSCSCAHTHFLSSLSVFCPVQLGSARSSSAQLGSACSGCGQSSSRQQRGGRRAQCD